MPKKLTMFGVLMALAFGAVMLFQGTATGARPPIQGFPASGPFQVDYAICFDGAAPSPLEFATANPAPLVGPNVDKCGVGSSAFHVANDGVVHQEYLLITLPQGDRQTLPISFIPSDQGVVAPGDEEWGVGNGVGSGPGAIPCAPDGNGDCTVVTPVGDVTARVDILCSGGAFDILAQAPLGVGAGLNGWPDATSYTPFTFNLVASGTAPGAASVNNYINQIKPFPAAFPFLSLSKALLNNLFVGGTVPTAIANTPLQLLRVRHSYVTRSLDVSVAILAGSPITAPQNDLLCLDSPQDSLTSITTEIPPTVDGLYPRWTILTSAADVVSGEVARIIDLQCIGVGGTILLPVTAGYGGTDANLPGGATDADDDCLPTPTDTNDANPDQDSDGVMDGIEARMGTSLTNPNSDSAVLNPDTASDSTELFDFTDAVTTGDTDGDGSRDNPDTGADEDGTGPTYMADTVADDNCPAVSNPDQLNSDSLNEYHGGTTQLAAALGTGAPATVIKSNGAGSTIFVVTGSGFGPGGLGFPANSFINIAGVTGSSAGNGGAAPSTAQDQNMRTAVNGVQKVNADSDPVLAGVQPPTGTQFAFTVPATGANTTTLNSTATGTFITRPVTGDINGGFGQYSGTNPDADTAGDACDTDADNDNLPNVNETISVTGADQSVGAGATALRIGNWPAGSGPGCNADPPSLTCSNGGTPARGTMCIPVSGYTGIATILGFPGATPGGGSTSLKALNGDSDQDMVLDGIECIQGSRPDMSNKAAAAFAANDGSADCVTPNNPVVVAPRAYTSVDPDGCAQPKNPATVPNEDRDAGAGQGKDDLYFSGCVVCSGDHVLMEQFYRTMNIINTVGLEQNETDCDTVFGANDKDSDADWNSTMTLTGYLAPAVDPGIGCTAPVGASNTPILSDGAEVRFYGTDAANPDTDNDGCDDAREVADVSGDRHVTAVDPTTLSVPTNNYRLANGTVDVTKAANTAEPKQGILNRDVNKDANLTAGDKTFIQTAQGKAGDCTGAQLGISVGVSAKNP